MSFLVGAEVLDRPQVVEAKTSPHIRLRAVFTLAVTDTLGRVDTAVVGFLMYPAPQAAQAYPFSAVLTDEVGQEDSVALAITINPEED